MKLLITGGAGFIGSHTIKQLLRRGYDVAVYDNLSEGHRELILCDEFVKADLNVLRKTFERYTIEAVMHFATFCKVDESIRDLRKYYKNNVLNGLNLLRAMLEHNIIKLFIFSSSAAVYSDPIKIPIPEGHPKRPKNPYSQTKLIFEQVLEDYARAYGLRYTSSSLRYFNAAGSDPEGQIGEWHNPETHPHRLGDGLRGAELCGDLRDRL